MLAQGLVHFASIYTVAAFGALLACEAATDMPDDAERYACTPGVHDVAAPEDAPYRLVVAEPYVYWSTAVAAGSKQIKRAALASGVVEIVAATTRELAAFAVDDDGTVYWVEASAAQDNAGAVMALRPGQAPTELYAIAEGLDAFGMVIDEAHVYWLVHGQGGAFSHTVYRGPKAGGSPQALGTHLFANFDANLGGMIRDGDFIYWSVGAGFVLRVNREGGTTEAIVDELDGLGAFAIHGGNLYAIVRDEAASIIRVTPDSQQREVVASGFGARWALALDDDHIYFSTVDDRILATPRASGDAGAVTVIAAEGVRAAGGLGRIGDRLYWTNTATAANGGSVRWACRANPTAADPSDPHDHEH